MWITQRHPTSHEAPSPRAPPPPTGRDLAWAVRSLLAARPLPPARDHATRAPNYAGPLQEHAKSAPDHAAATGARRLGTGTRRLRNRLTQRPVLSSDRRLRPPRRKITLTEGAKPWGVAPDPSHRWRSPLAMVAVGGL